MSLDNTFERGKEFTFSELIYTTKEGVTITGYISEPALGGFKWISTKIEGDSADGVRKYMSKTHPNDGNSCRTRARAELDFEVAMGIMEEALTHAAAH